MIRNLNPIFLPSLIYFKREEITNISYNFLSPLDNDRYNLSIKNILKNIMPLKNKSSYFLDINKFMIKSVINIKKIIMTTFGLLMSFIYELMSLII